MALDRLAPSPKRSPRTRFHPAGICSEALVSRADARRLPCHDLDHADEVERAIAFAARGVDAAAIAS
jgi:hypothetical protein